MLKIKDNKVNAKDVYDYIEVKSPYRIWVNRCIEYADFKEGIDFSTFLYESTGGRPAVGYLFSVDAAKEMCILSHTLKSKELRQWLIGLSKQKEKLELLTIKEAAFAVKVVNCMKYIDNQKEAYSLHQKHFVDNNSILDEKYIYAEFAKYRAKITGWDKLKVDESISKYLEENVGYSKKLVHSNMQTKLSAMDIGEAIRISVLDILYSKDADKDLANKFSEMCKKLAKEMEVKPEKQNTTNLFQKQEAIESVKSLSINNI